MRPERRSREEGYVLVVLAGTLFILLGFAALAVDVGYMYSSRASSQRAADAAALAGAFTFISSPMAPQPATAQDRALNTAVRNYVMASQIGAGEVAVNVDVANRRVTVDIDRQENTFFGKVLGWVVADIRVRGIAEASRTATGSSCVKPWFIPNTLPTDVKDCNDLATACSTGHVLVDSNHNATEWVMDPANGVIGQEFRIKPGRPNDAIAPGQFYAINLVPGCDTGGNDYRCNIATCGGVNCDCQQNGPVMCGDFYDVKTGNMIGPTRQGVEDFTTLYGTASTDTWVGWVDGVPNIRHPDGTVSDISRQIAIAPVWDICPMVPTLMANGCKFPTGTQVSVAVVGFAILFIDGMNGNDVVAHLIGVQGCGPTPPPDQQTGPFAVPLRLVRTS